MYVHRENGTSKLLVKALKPQLGLENLLSKSDTLCPEFIAYSGESKSKMTVLNSGGTEIKWS